MGGKEALSLEKILKLKPERSSAASSMVHTNPNGELIRLIGHEGIEVRNRSLQEVLRVLFSDEIWADKWNNQRSWFQKLRKQTIVNNYHYIDTYKETDIQISKPALGITEFFSSSGAILDLGCGPGLAALELAQKCPSNKIIGVDYEFGGVMPLPETNLPNLTYIAADWNALPLPTNSVDRILASSSAFAYERPDSGLVPEVTRVARPSAILRAECMPQSDNVCDLESKGNSLGFARELAKNGWNVYMYGWLLAAQKK